MQLIQRTKVDNISNESFQYILVQQSLLVNSFLVHNKRSWETFVPILRRTIGKSACNPMPLLRGALRLPLVCPEWRHYARCGNFITDSPCHLASPHWIRLLHTDSPRRVLWTSCLHLKPLPCSFINSYLHTDLFPGNSANSALSPSPQSSSPPSHWFHCIYYINVLRGYCVYLSTFVPGFFEKRRLMYLWE